MASSLSAILDVLDLISWVLVLISFSSSYHGLLSKKREVPRVTLELLGSSAYLFFFFEVSFVAKEGKRNVLMIIIYTLYVVISKQ